MTVENVPTSLATFHDLVASVGEVLPGSWDLKPYGEDNWACTLFDPDRKMRLFFRPAEWKDATRIEIRGELPKDSRGQEPYLPSLPTGHRMPSIKVAGSKSPDQIARDIERRLLPDLIPLIEEALERIAQSETYYTKVTSVAQEIAQLLRVDIKPDAKKVSFYHSPYPPFTENIGSANIGSDEVELELHLAPDTALAVLSMLKKRGG